MNATLDRDAWEEPYEVACRRAQSPKRRAVGYSPRHSKPRSKPSGFAGSHCRRKKRSGL